MNYDFVDVKQWKRDKYEIVRGAVNYDLSNFLFNYIMAKRAVSQVLLNDDSPLSVRNFKKYAGSFGSFWDKAEVMNKTGKGTFNFYSDIAIETLLLKIKPQVEKIVGEKVYPIYSYGRVYKTGDIVEPHTNTPEHEISASIFLGGNNWDMYIHPGFTQPGSTGERQQLNVGDMMVYSGSELEHKRDEFEGKICAQVFLHYQRQSNPDANPFHGRGQIGLPENYKK